MRYGNGHLIVEGREEEEEEGGVAGTLVLC